MYVQLQENLSLLPVWKENFAELKPFDKNFGLTKELLNIIKAKDEFVAKLKSIEDSVVHKTREASKEEAIKLYKQKQSLKLCHKSPFSKFSEQEFTHTTELLNLNTTNITKSRRISIRLDIKNFYSKLADFGFYSAKRKSPISNHKLIFLNDYEIISFYNKLIRDYLNWFSCVNNFTSAKNIIWTLRISCLKTLARKHNKNLKWALTIYTINVTTESQNGENFSLPSVHEISKRNTKFLLKNPCQEPDIQNLLNKYFLRFHSSHHLFSKCAVEGCSNIDIELHYVKDKSKRITSNTKINILTSNNKRLSGISAILSSINRKQIPFCSLHHLEFETGNHSRLDTPFLTKIYNVDSSANNFN